MKKSRRLIRDTLLAVCGAMVLYIGINRLYAVAESPTSPQRTSPAELALLRDFDSVDVGADFAVEVVQRPSWSVEVTPVDSVQGTFTATIRGKTLVLRGTGDHVDSRVRVGLPTLTQLRASGVPGVTITGFTAAELSLWVAGVPQVTLRNNGVRRWRVVSSGSDATRVQIDKASFGAGSFDLAGRASLSIVE